MTSKQHQIEKHIHSWSDDHSGEQYVGEHKDGKFHGQGTYTWPDGRKYVGENKDGKFHGQGTMTSPDGGQNVGLWRKGKLVEKSR